MTPSLPVELWRRIFRLATYTGADLDQAVKHELDSDKFTEFKQNNLDVMETKLAISRVSRQFRSIASEFLFEFVSIDKPSQALKLEIMLQESSNSDHGPRNCIKFLFVKCMDDSITARVSNALLLCRGLRGFSWNHPRLQTRFESRRVVEERMLRSIPTNIRLFNWNSMVHLNALDAFLHNASASLEGLYINGFLLDPPSTRCTTFPALTHLEVRQLAPCAWPDKWIIPSLNELHLPYSYSGDRCPGLLTHSSKSLRVLRFGTSFILTEPLLSQIVTTCPELEEIYYFTHPGDSSPWESDITHALLRRVVVHHSCTGFNDYDTACDHFRDYFEHISKARFPSLHAITVDDVSVFPPPGYRIKVVMESTSENVGLVEIREV